MIENHPVNVRMLAIILLVLSVSVACDDWIFPAKPPSVQHFLQ